VAPGIVQPTWTPLYRSEPALSPRVRRSEPDSCRRIDGLRGAAKNFPPPRKGKSRRRAYEGRRHQTSGPNARKE